MAHSIEDIWQEIEAASDRHEIGGAVALIQQRGHTVLHRATGWKVREPEAERDPMTLDAIFDLASITKVIATMPAILQLIDQGKISLDDMLATHIPEFGDTGSRRHVTIRNLLTHSSGIIGWRAVYTQGTGIDAYIRNLATDQPYMTPDSRVEYSCMGFILLGEIVRRTSGLPIDQYAKRNIWQPLGMNDTTYLPPSGLRDRIVATEIGNRYETGTAGADPIQGWRDYLLRGEVHDGNAWYGLGGISGNAGAFGTADDLLRYATMWRSGGELNGVRILSTDLVREATREQTGLAVPNERRGLGWQMAPHPETPETMASARGLSVHAYGHTGFTGTSIWIDPDRELVSILLATRVHPTYVEDWGRTRANISHMLANLFPTN